MDALNKFINSHEDWQELLTAPPYNLLIKPYGQYVLLKYSMIESDFDLPEVNCARGHIYKKVDNEWKCVCRPFDKFWNYGEDRAASIDWNNSVVTEKVDGCFTGTDEILLADGTTRKIKDIVNKKQNVEVLSYNFITKKIEPKKVVGWNKSEHLYPIEDWLTISLAGVKLNPKGQLPPYNKITPTKNHVFFRKNFVNNTIEEVRADALNIGDIVYTPTSGLTEIERQVILGGWLGDGSCLQQHEVMRNKGFYCRHSLKQKDYVDYKASLFKIPHKTRSYRVDNSFGKEKYELTTHTYGDINNLYDLCYKNEQKYVTKEWLKELNWLGFAIWYMDDGSLHKGCKSTSIHLHTEGFSEKEVDTIIDFYTEKGYKLYKTSYRGYFIINFSTESSELIYQKIRTYICPSMQYKLPERHRGYFNENIIKESQESETEIVLREGQIINIEQGLTAHNPYKSKKMYRYDIEVEDNHNYFCQGVLVHNSMICLWWDDGWHWSTSGNVDASAAPVNGTYKTFGDLIDEAIKYRYGSIEDFLKIAEGPDKGYSTHIFELVSLDSKVVVPYEQTDLFYLGSRFLESGNYYNAGFKNKPQEFLLNTIDDIIAAAAELDWKHEGFVVFDGVNRIKCKSPAWVVAHHSVANGVITDKTLVNLIITDEIDELLVYCPEYAARVNDWKEKLAMWCIYGNAQKTNMKEFCDAPRAEYAEKVHKFALKEYWDFLFKCYKDWDYKIEEYLKLNWKKIWF